MGDRLIGGDDPERAEDEEPEPLPYVQAGPSGGTMTLYRQPHPNAAMEERFRDAEGGGFRIELREHEQLGRYYWFEDGCDPSHVGTVSEQEVYGIVVERIVHRCPKYKEWKLQQKKGEEGS